MNKKLGIITGVLVLLLVITGVVVYKAVFSGSPAAPPITEEEQEILPEADSSLVVSVTKSKTEANTVVIGVKGLNNKYSTIAYELTYDSQGLIKGVNSGSKPAEVAGKDTFERPIYLGTCSRNVCKADVGVSKISLVLQFTDVDGKKTQFSKEYELP